MVTQNVAEIIRHHVMLEVEGIDRMYLNAYVPGLQTEGGFVHIVRQHMGYPIASTAVVAPRSDGFVRAIEQFVKTQGVDQTRACIDCRVAGREIFQSCYV